MVTAKAVEFYPCDRVIIDVALEPAFGIVIGFTVFAAGVGNGFDLGPNRATRLDVFGELLDLALCRRENLVPSQAAKVTQGFQAILALVLVINPRDPRALAAAL